jgi:hypothetical protein
MGGIHPTIFPDEPLEMGADAVVTGNGDIVWKQVIKDALDGRLQRRYPGGRVPGDALLKARWDLLDPRHYMFATVQTVAGCPENCSFCSVWVTDGRQPRQRLTDKIVEEVNELYRLGFRHIVFADDNFNPATLGRIAREPSPRKRKQLEQIREERLRFFDQYDRSVPPNLYAFTQMTTEVTSDEEVPLGDVSQDADQRSVGWDRVVLRGRSKECQQVVESKRTEDGGDHREDSRRWHPVPELNYLRS